jgi:hypothetical protein
MTFTLENTKDATHVILTINGFEFKIIKNSQKPKYLNHDSCWLPSSFTNNWTLSSLNIISLSRPHNETKEFWTDNNGFVKYVFNPEPASNEMNTKELIPIDFSRNITPVVPRDVIYSKLSGNEFIANDADAARFNNDEFDPKFYFVVSFADRPNTGTQPVGDDVVVDMNCLCDPEKAKSISWSSEYQRDDSWKPNKDAMLKQWQTEQLENKDNYKENHMSKLPLTKEDEAKTIARIWNMAGHSLPHHEYNELEKTLSMLCVNRNIDNELISHEHITMSSKSHHHSDCRTSDAPALIPGPCNCDLSPTDKPSEINAATALYAFAGWLTSMKEPITFSANNWATPAADMVASFIELNGLGGDINFDSVKTPSDSVIPKEQLENIASERLANLNEDKLISHADMVVKFDVSPMPREDASAEEIAMFNDEVISHEKALEMLGKGIVKLKPVFTQAQADAGELPMVGSKPLVIGRGGTDYIECEILMHREIEGYGPVAVFTITNYSDVEHYYSHCSANKFKPIQTAEDKLRDAINELWDAAPDKWAIIEDILNNDLFEIKLKG